MIFTVAIPVYNGGGTIAAALDSCLGQDCEFDYEVLVVDNASTDGTAQALKPYEGRANIIRNASTVTMYENHNVCLARAKGQYVLFCHADDVMRPHALRVLSAELASCDYPDRFVLWGRSMYGDYAPFLRHSGVELNQVFAGIQAVKPFLYSGLPPAGTCFSRASMLELGGFVHVDHPLCPNDWVTMMLLALRGFEFKMIGRLYCLRKFSSTLPDSTPFDKRLDSYAAAISGLLGRLEDWDVNALLEMAMELKYPPLDFLYGCVVNHISARRIKRFLLRKAIINPYVAVSPVTRHVLLCGSP